MKIKDTIAELKKGNIQNYYLIAGTEDYLRELAQKSILSHLDIQMEEFNVTILQSETNASELISHLESLPMMSDRRVVIADMQILLETDIKKIEPVIYHLPVSTILILRKNTAYDKRKAIENFISKNGCIVDCNEPTEGETADFICGFAAKKERKIAKQDALYFIHFISGDLNRLLSELSKLCLVCTDSITRKDIQKYCIQSEDFNIFRLHELLLQKKWQSAAELLIEITNEDANPIGLLSILASNFELMLIARACLDARYTHDKIMKSILSSAKVAEFRAKKAIEQAGYLDAPSIRKAIQAIARLDFDSKQGSVVLKNDLFPILCGIYGMGKSQ